MGKIRRLENMTCEGRLKEWGLFLLKRTGRWRGQELGVSIYKQLLDMELIIAVLLLG